VPGRAVLLTAQLATEGRVELPLPLHLQLANPPPDAEQTISRRWSARPASAQRIRPLPPIAARPASSATATSSQLPLGVGSGGPVIADLEATDRYLLVVGDPGTGRSTVLAAVGRALEDAECWLVDPSGSLGAAAPRAHQVGRTPQQIETLLTDLHARLLSVMNGERPPRRRLLLVDDLEVATTLTSAHGWSALATLLPLAAAHLRLTVAVARRCAGMARMVYEPFLGTLRDSGATGVLLSGSPDEGPIVAGVRCRPSPVGRALLVRPGQPPRPLQLYADPQETPDRSQADDCSSGVEGRGGAARPRSCDTANPGVPAAAGGRATLFTIAKPSLPTSKVATAAISPCGVLAHSTYVDEDRSLGASPSATSQTCPSLSTT
jgi:hypothetical protein